MLKSMATSAAAVGAGQSRLSALVSPVSPLDEWLVEGPEGHESIAIKSNFQVNVAEAMLLSIRESMGIGVLPIYSAVDPLRSGTIVRVLPQYRMQQMGVYALYPSRQYLDAKISTWVDWMHESVDKALQEDHWRLTGLPRIRHDRVQRKWIGQVRNGRR